MKVLYETTILAQGQRVPIFRAGIYRVIENMLAGLASCGECSLTACVAEQAHCLGPMREYLDGEPRLASVALVPNGIKGRLIQRASSLRESLTGAKALSARAIRRAAWGIETSSRLLRVREVSRYDIFHSGFYPIPATARKAGSVKKFLTLYDMIPVLRPDWFHTCETFSRIMASLVPGDWIICISESTRNDFLELMKWPEPSHVLVSYPAASEAFYPCGDEGLIAAVRRRYGIPEGARYLLSVATLEPRKNIDCVIRTFAELLKQEQVPDLYLVLVGIKGWYFDKIFEAAGDATVRDRVIFTGQVPDGDLPPIYSGALAFIYLSLYEGFGLPPLEAMKCGSPVITSNNSSLPEVVGGAGIMVDPRDSEALCQAILRVYRSSALREELSAKSLSRASQFSWKRCVDEVIRGYRMALEGTARACEKSSLSSVATA